MWHIGMGKEGGGFGIYRMLPGSGKWVKIPGSAVRIACGSDGNAWVVNKQKNIYQYTGKGWKRIPGKANDVGISHDGTVWIVGNNAESKGWGIYRLKGGKGGWEKISGNSALRISVDPEGNAWTVNKDGTIHKHDGKKWQK